jgi:hypothetical protein
MGKQLTDELSDFVPTSLLDGISAYQHEFGRARLIERLSDIAGLFANMSASRDANMKQFHPPARNNVAPTPDNSADCGRPG